MCYLHIYTSIYTYIHLHTYTHRRTERFILRNWSSKSKICRTGRKLETQVRGTVAVLSLKSIEQPAGCKVRRDFYVAVLRQYSFFHRKNPFALKAVNWLHEVQPCNGGLSPLFEANWLWMLITAPPRLVCGQQGDSIA